ncbi:MAG TPA: hypothetical protein VFG71_04000 [Nitrospiraceae bacterium]|nr:hypothetical protein [Nitrospiraceae bacterium]
MAGILLVRDALTIPNRPARIEARLVQQNLVGEIGLGGESLQLEIAGKAVASAMTGGDGRAYFEYTPKMRGNVTFAVTLANSPRVEASRAPGLLAVWEHRRPILLVESLALVEQPSELPALPFGKSAAAEIKPSPDAAEELGRMAQFYYNVMYVAAQNEGPFSAAKVGQFRQWLGDNGFPTGLVLHATITSEGLGATLDELKNEGWIAMKAGIGRSTAFAATLVERRMEAVLVPEPSKGEVPRKAKTAKDWKDVRKKL